MPLGRSLMLFGLVLLPVGLVYGMSTPDGAVGKSAMYVELTCLAVGALVFILGAKLDRKRS
jgi:hypothetical protein